MKAIIPVAGQGTRLLPHTEHTQKCLLPVAGRPILEHLIQPLIEIGVDEIVLIIGHLGEQVVEFCKSISPVRFTFVEQKQRLGLGHAIFQGLKQVDEPVLIMLGDTIFKMDFRALGKADSNVIAVVEVKDPERFGIVELKDGKIIRFHEKPENPPTNLAIGGVYYLQSQAELYSAINHLIDNDIRTKNEYQLTDGLQNMLDQGAVFIPQTITEWLDCGLPETTLQTNQRLLQLAGGSAVSDSATVLNSELRNCHVSDFCSIVNSELNNVILLENASVQDSKISHQIIGRGEMISGRR
ncbi:MAG: nucleotidyltransferase family protein [FCB group bacterium]|nr:nucleotidyltransferase family protein [FCB group bacterium]